MVERIQPENNRTFKTGSADWTGDFTWEVGVLSGHQGYIHVTINSPDTSKTISLSYPGIAPVPGKYHLFNSHECKIQYDYGPNLIEVLLTDGVYSFTKQCSLPSGPLFWDSCGEGFDIPADWDVPNTVLEITINRIHADPGHVALDDFSLTYETIARPQYLPLVGVG